MEVLAVQERFTLCCTVVAATPVPARAWVAGEFDALLATLKLAEAFPLDCGVKVAVKEALCPAAMVAGKVKPLTLNSAVLGVMEDTVTLDPDAVSVAVAALLDPTVTLPKLSVAGLTVNWLRTVPVPESGMERVVPELMTRLPVALPLVCGANVIPKVKL